MTWLGRRAGRAAGMVVVVLGLAARVAAAPTFQQVRDGHRPSDVALLDRAGRPLQSLRVDPAARRLPWLALEDHSAAVRRAIVLSEDQRFDEHAGVDWRGLARSAVHNLTGPGRSQGASTLTMQLAGLVDLALARPAGGRSVGAKLGQIVAAREIETRWTKAQILEAYLNRVPLRGELIGVPAAAQVLFGKRPSGLDEQEAALLAALIRAPNAPPAAVARCACALLQRLGRGCDGLEGLAVQSLRPGVPMIDAEPLAPHFARAWRQAHGQPDAGARATVDAGLQRLAVTALRQQLAELAGRDVEDGAVVVLDNATGDVLAWVGSSGALSKAPAVDAVLARRQPGSTLKPFVYGLAFERRLITPASLLEDAPTALPAGAGLYLPQNYDRHYRGWVSARTALAASLNVPAVKVGAMLSPDAMFERFNAVGLRLRHSGGWHGYALALGSAEVTLLDLTNAYRALANGGRWSPVRLRPVTEAPAWRRVASEAATFVVSDILADNAARAPTFGFDSLLVTSGWTAVKTGTSKDLRDNWCVGYSDRYTVGVWVGNAAGTPMHRVSGTTGAAPVWHAVMQWLHAGHASRPPIAPPAGVVAAAGPAGAGGPAREWFLADTQPATLVATGGLPGRGLAFGITAPADGSVFALDPDMPAPVQRIVMTGSGGRWFIDGRAVGQGRHATWAPWPGRHTVRLEMPDGRVDERRFEVRGAAARPARPGGRAPNVYAQTQSGGAPGATPAR